MIRLARLAALIGVGAALLATPMRAQDTTGMQADTARVDTVAADASGPPVSPMGAFWRSFVLPGWGQAALGRRTAAGIFAAWEGVTLAMAIKTQRELNYLRETNSERASDKARQREDWLVLLAFNHLLSGLEAYVSAHLWDFPGDLHVTAVPNGIGAGVSLPVRLP